MSDTTTTAAVLSDELVASYHEDGYLLLDSFVDREWLDRLRAAAARWVDESRSLTRSARRLAIKRPSTSTLLPGGKPEMTRIGRLGYCAVCACVCAVISASGSTAPIKETLLAMAMNSNEGEMRRAGNVSLLETGE